MVKSAVIHGTKGQIKDVTTMGMAASQARLLTITARLHDVEYQAQSIQNAKITLATQQDQVQQEYLEALDATTLTVTAINPMSGETSKVAATFNNLFGRDRVRSATGSEYVLRDKNGNVVVENAMWERYQDFLDAGYGDSPYMFAMYMMGADLDLDDFEPCLYQAENATRITGEPDDKLEDLREAVLDTLYIEGSDRDADWAPYDTSAIYDDEDAMAAYQEAFSEYSQYLYTHYASTVLDKLEIIADKQGLGMQEFDIDEFNYYVHMYQTIKECGGCTSIENFNGPNGDAKNDSEWLQAMVQSGLMTIDIINVDKKGEVSFTGTHPGSDANLAYTATTEIDKTAMAKAEAKYNHALKEIDRKDKKFDLDLSKLETERTALTTEYESVKKVIEDNIDRTFGIFS